MSTVPDRPPAHRTPIHTSARHVEMVDPYDVEVGETIRRIPSEPRRDGVVAWFEVDEHGDEEFHLADGRTYRAPHGQPVAVVRPGEAWW